MRDLPEIVESYRDFTPPRNFKKLVTNLLEVVPAEFLSGLAAIVLTNGAALSRDQRKQKVWSRNRKIPLTKALGSYQRATRNSGAEVWLYVDNISKFLGPTILRVPFFCYFPVKDTLYHEIGHHIHAAHRPEYRGKEDVADAWVLRLERRFYREHFWYLRPAAFVALPFVIIARGIVKWVRRMRQSSR